MIFLKPARVGTLNVNYMFSYMINTHSAYYADELYVKHFHDLECSRQIWVMRFMSSCYLGNEINHPSRYVREVVAIRGTDAERAALVSDPSAYVRSIVARFGSDQLRWQLKDDKSSNVRTCVYKYTNDENLRDYIASRKWTKNFTKTVLKTATNKKHIAKARILTK